MPKDYEKRRDSCIKKGGSVKSCKKKAAIATNIARKKAGKPPAKFHRKKG